MLRALTDSLNSVSLARDHFRRKYPDEDILFCSAVTILETRSESPVGWSFRRFLQRRGSVVITDKRLLLKSNPLSLMALFLVAIIVWLLWQFIHSQDMLMLLVSIPCTYLVFQRRPYQRMISQNEIKDIRLGTVEGMFARCSLLTLVLGQGAVNIVPAQMLPENVIALLKKQDTVGRE